MPIPKEQEHFDAARKFQAHYDDVLRQVGMRAPQPILGQTVNRYRRETMRTMKRTYLPQNHPLYAVNMRGLPADSITPIETQLLPAVVVEANNPATVPKGEFRRVDEIDAHGGLRTTRWIGQECFVKQMGRPGRLVVSFNTSNGPVDASGRFLR